LLDLVHELERSGEVSQLAALEVSEAFASLRPRLLELVA
jgi:hypothetical protein